MRERILLTSELKSVTETDFISIVSGYVEDEKITDSQINVDLKNHCYTISYWHTEKEYQHQGYGIKALRKNIENVVSVFGLPAQFKYIWNGANQYVLDWLISNFDAKSEENLNVAKYEAGESWEGHIYGLDTQKVIEYFLLIVK